MHAVSADNFAAGAVFDDEVIAEEVEGILVETGVVRGSKALAQLDIEDFEAEAAGGFAFGERGSKAKAISAAFNGEERSYRGRGGRRGGGYDLR